VPFQENFVCRYSKYGQLISYVRTWETVLGINSLIDDNSKLGSSFADVRLGE
jgi:hypothetical protein